MTAMDRGSSSGASRCGLSVDTGGPPKHFAFASHLLDINTHEHHLRTQNLLGQTRGTISGNTSIEYPRSEMAAYCASKGALLRLTRAMAIDHAKGGIRVNAVCPDNVETPMLRAEAEQLGVKPSTYFARAARAIAMGRNGQPEDITTAVVFLASDKAGWITGVGLPLDGG